MEWRIAVYNDVCLLTVNLYRECNSVKLNNKILITSDRTEITAVSAAMKMVDEYSVWQFGRDITINQKIKSELPDGIKVGEISALLNQCADKVEDSLLNLDAQVIPGIKDQLAWESSLLADRSPWAGDLHLNSARYLVLDIIIARGGHHIFFIDDVVAGYALVETARVNGHNIEWYGPIPSGPSYLKSFRSRLSVLKTIWSHSRYLKKLRRNTPVPVQELRACDILILDWAMPSSFVKDAHTNRVGKLNRIPQILRDAGFRIGFIANPISWVSTHKEITDRALSAKDPVVMLNDLRSVRSAIEAAWNTWRMIKNLSRRFVFKETNLSPLFELECNRDLASTRSIDAYTFSKIAMNLAKWKVCPKVIVFPFENQGWERALIHGFHQYQPKTKIIAYQHSPFSRRHLSFFCSRENIKKNRIPDQLMLTGDHFKSLYIKKGYPEDKLLVVGGLNFEMLLDAAPKKYIENKKFKNILCTTSIELRDSLDLIIKAIFALENMENSHLIVNFHPVLNDTIREEIVRITHPLALEKCIDIKFSKASSNVLVQQADVVLYNNSGTVFEAKITGVPSIYVSTDGQLCYDKVPDESSSRANSIDELHEYLILICSSQKRNIHQDKSVGDIIGHVSSESIRKLFFENIDQKFKVL
jgi:hypothetical protein